MLCPSQEHWLILCWLALEAARAPTTIFPYPRDSTVFFFSFKRGGVQQQARLEKKLTHFTNTIEVKRKQTTLSFFDRNVMLSAKIWYYLNILVVTIKVHSASTAYIRSAVIENKPEKRKPRV